MHLTGSVSPTNERRVSCDIEAPAPPPPPPPPPEDLSQKRRVRSFFWKTIPKEQVTGRANLWTQGRVQQQYQIDVQTIEELFGQKDQGGKTRSSFRETREEVSILDPKRGMNMGIFLKQFKRSSQTIVDDIHGGNSGIYGADSLRELLKLLPDAEEVSGLNFYRKVEKLKAYRGDVSRLPLADSFVYLLIQLPSYSVRIESMLLKEEFPGTCEAMKHDITVLRAATKELMCCEELHAVLHLVLQAGNILNAGGHAGNAMGFKLSSLLSLADTKANKPGVNLLHFVALEAHRREEKLLEFPLKLPHVPAAARISLETLDAELQLMTTRTCAVEESIQRDTELLQQLDGFLQCATASLCSLRCSRQQLKKEGSELVDFFCEDRETFRLDDCFGIFHTFCSRFSNAVKENFEREAKEAAHRRRIQELDEQKRHSWAGGEEVAGLSRFRCSSETNMSLMSYPRSPLNDSRSSLGHPGSLQRSRNSPSSSPSVAAERDLSTFLKMATPDHKVAQRSRGNEARIGWPLASPESAFGSPGHSLQTRAQSPGFRVGQTASQNPSSPPKNSNDAVATYLSDDAVQDIPEKPTSDSNQQFDSNNNDKDRLSLTPTTVNRVDQERLDQRTATTGSMSVVVDMCTLVPELKAFDRVATLTNASGLPGCLKNLEEKGVDKSKVGTDSQTGNVEESEEQVVVWCVTGVCEAAGTQTSNTQTPNEMDQRHGDNQGGSRLASSASASRPSSKPQPANEKPVPVPISSQPVPVYRCNDPRLCPASEAPALRRDTPVEGKEDSTDVEQSAEYRSRKSEPSTSSKPSTTALTSKTQRTGTKPAPANKTRPVRTLTSSENQDMRRVVPISRAGRQASSSAAAPTGQRERPSTAPSSRRSSIQKTPEPKDANDQNVSGTRASPQQQNRDSLRRPSIQKTLTKAKPQPEEKMCRSTLRALTLAAQGGGGSVSAPATPLHRASIHSLLPVPGFARSTASSSFRRSHAILTAPAPTRSTHAISALPESSPDNTVSSSVRPPGTSPPLLRTGSLRVSTAGRSPDVLNTPSSPPLQRSQCTRVRPRLPLHGSLAATKGHRRNDSGSHSDKSTHSKDSGKATRPSWR